MNKLIDFYSVFYICRILKYSSIHIVSSHANAEAEQLCG